MSANQFARRSASAGITTATAPAGSVGAARRDATSPYPHRLSVDVDEDMYKALRLAAAQQGLRMVEIIRTAVARHLNT